MSIGLLIIVIMVIRIYDREIYILESMVSRVIESDEVRYLNKCIETGFVSYVGKFVETFEKKLSNFTKSKFVVATSSGTAALHLILDY